MANMMNVRPPWYTEIFNSDYADPLLFNKPLVNQPIQLSMSVAVWLYFILKLGPKLMENRKPFDLRGLVQGINLAQIVLNAYVVYEIFVSGVINGYHIGCVHKNNPNAQRLANATYVYFLLKIFDMVDTVIFVLRRKNNQVSFLHVYHHLITLFMAYNICVYAPGGMAVFVEITNSAVHVVMYVYYFIAALGPEFQKFIWWKKYLTRFQIVQFLAQFAMSLYAVYQWNTCETPRWMIALFIPFLIFMLSLFVSFYIASYRRQNRTAAQEAKEKHKVDNGKTKSSRVKAQ